MAGWVERRKRARNPAVAQHLPCSPPVLEAPCASITPPGPCDMTDRSPTKPTVHSALRSRRHNAVAHAACSRRGSVLASCSHRSGQRHAGAPRHGWRPSTKSRYRISCEGPPSQRNGHVSVEIGVGLMLYAPILLSTCAFCDDSRLPAPLRTRQWKIRRL